RPDGLFLGTEGTVGEMARGRYRIRNPRERAVATLEFSLLTPLLFLLFLSLTQLVIYLQSSTATQYAAFTAARAYQVYGQRTLESIAYPRVRGLPYTAGEQTIAEAAAEKVIFESLMWEHKNIDVQGDASSLDRYYRDGIDASVNSASSSPSEGAVRINFLKGQGARITYCLPIIAPGINALFSLVREKYPCRNSRTLRHYDGIAITEEAKFGVEPEVNP
ncbi:MAG: TadE/TadG family type IV pilus assembly protein, partial [Pseudomonadota bacterium]